MWLGSLRPRCAPTAATSRRTTSPSPEARVSGPATGASPVDASRRPTPSCAPRCGRRDARGAGAGDRAAEAARAYTGGLRVQRRAGCGADRAPGACAPARPPPRRRAPAAARAAPPSRAYAAPVPRAAPPAAPRTPPPARAAGYFRRDQAARRRAVPTRRRPTPRAGPRRESRTGPRRCCARRRRCWPVVATAAAAAAARWARASCRSSA